MASDRGYAWEQALQATVVDAIGQLPADAQLGARAAMERGEVWIRRDVDGTVSVVIGTVVEVRTHVVSLSPRSPPGLS